MSLLKFEMSTRRCAKDNKNSIFRIWYLWSKVNLYQIFWTPWNVIWYLQMSNLILSAGRADLAAREKEREERVRRLREQQEDDRRRKLEELKQHVSIYFNFLWFLYSFLFFAGSTSPEISRATRVRAKTTYRKPEDEGHGQKTAGGGEEEGDREVRAWQEGGNHPEESRERQSSWEPATKQSQ